MIISTVFFGAICLAQLELSEWDTRGTVDRITAAARIYQDFPPWETLAPEELAGVLEVWDAALLSTDPNDRIDALRLIEGRVPAGYRLEGGHVLRYDNPEIVDRLIHLYLVEIERRRRMLGGGEPVDDKGEIAEIVDPSLDGETCPDYLDYLGMLAESTFSPIIYDVELWSESAGGLEFVYLASVNPETTLELLFEMELRTDKSDVAVLGILDHSEYSIRSMSVHEALALIGLLCERSPDVVVAERDRVLDFVREHGKHYLTPVQRKDKTEPKYLWRLDYKTRRLALRTLEHFAHVEGVYSIVRDIMHDPPKNPSAASGNEIIKLGEEIMEQIQALE